MIHLSIIMPIYNTGKYLHKCIDSILSQTLTDFELILVDDGSIDESGTICDKYASQDDRIKVIHKENEGVSIARNTGLKIAQGEYIGFIDSDDWIEPDMYEKLYNLALKNSCDIVMCDTVTKYDDKPDEEDTITQLPEDVLLMKEQISPKLLCEIAGSACRCIYRRQILINNNVLFPKNIPLSEDRIFNILAMGYANAVYYTKNPFYNRYVRKGSAVSKYHINMCSIIDKVRNGYMEAIEMAWNDRSEYKLIYEKQIVHMTHGAINNAFYKDSPKNFKEKIEEIKEICSSQLIQNTIKVTGATDVRSRLIERKNIFILSIIAIMLNMKHGR